MMLCVPNDAQCVDIPGPVPRIGVLASGRGSNFDVLAEHAQQGSLGVHMVTLVCNVEGANVLHVAKKYNIPSVVIAHAQHPSREAFDEAVVAHLLKHQVEWVVMAGWMRIVTPVFLEAFPDRALNIHPSLLPSFKGMSAIEQAFTSKVKLAGCTVHLVRAAIDDGPIVAQACVPVLDGDDLYTLTARIQSAEHHMFPRAIARAIAAHRISRSSK